MIFKVPASLLESAAKVKMFVLRKAAKRIIKRIAKRGVPLAIYGEQAC